MTKGIMIETGARLHFGLLDLTGDLGRVDGGLGVSIREPRLLLRAIPSEDISSNLHEKIVSDAIGKLNDYFGLGKGLAVDILEHYPQHVGLGSSTQLLLSIGKAYTELYGIKSNTRKLATILGRGGTSGIGVAAFEGGGFILDAGHSFGPGKDKEEFLPSRASKSPPAHLLFRGSLPANWIFDVIVPNVSRGLSGQEELDFFTKHCPIAYDDTLRISHLVLSIILPSVVERDITTFIRGINLLSTLGFKKLEIENQFNGVKQIIQNLMEVTQEKAAIGMSSFGPTIFMISDIKTRKEFISSVKKIIDDFISLFNGYHFITRCKNDGARIITTFSQNVGSICLNV